MIDNTFSNSIDEWFGYNNISKPIEPSNATQQNFQLPSSSENIHDLTEQIRSWLDKSLVLSKSSNCEYITSELEALDLRWELPGCRIAFVGEFSRGKSSLINRLLNQDILPIGGLPTTATLISIVAGAEDSMKVRYPKKEWESRPMEEQSWRDLTAIDQNGNEQDVIAQVYLTLDHTWLKVLDAELIDTPGVEDLNERRAAFTLHLLSQCDAVVLLVSATIPFSKTEVTFLQQQIMGRHIPNILVAVSKFDTISLEERSDILEGICHRIGKISTATAISVLPLHSISDKISDSEAFETVKSQIESMLAKDDRRIWRSHKIAGQLTNYLSHLIEVGELAISTVQMDASEREKALNKANGEIQNARLNWEKIRLNLDQRRLDKTQMLHQKVFQVKAELLETISLELKKAQDPKTWWEFDLPSLLRCELFSLSRKLENDVLKALAIDFEWLQAEVSHLFSTNITGKEISSLEALEIDPDLRQVAVNDIQKYRLLTLLGSSAASIFSYIFVGPVGVAVSSTAWVIGDRMVKVKLEEQRQLITQELERSVDKTIDEYYKRLADRFKQLYNQLIEEITKEQTAWQASYEAALRVNTSELDEAHWLSIISQASALKEDILRAIAQ
ncbi:GTPase [Anabaena sp. UHCC 0253]|uniref:dynamin family protein n=1 Tax=Anabaena sp. UHCC 0253 TaxID=2590019 RepID=UPI0014487AEB|nr:dynamin family protein [Anabaena sp. UHCC 0253]MTJ51572.1 GTPase [Anabaena sp. UHCC 0253]